MTNAIFDPVLCQGENDSPDARLGGARTIELVRTRSSHVCLSPVIPAFHRTGRVHSLSQISSVSSEATGS